MNAALHSDDTLRIAAAADAALNAGEPLRAYEIANAAIEQGVQHPALFFARATWFARNNRYEEALADFRRVLAHFPNRPGLRIAMGNCQIRLGRFRMALESFDAAIAAAPKFALAYERKGLALAMLSQAGAAETAYRRAVEFNPACADALANLAMMATARDPTDERAKLFAERALAADSRQLTARIALAMRDMGNGNISAAEETLRSVACDAEFGGDPRAAMALVHLADLLSDKDRIDAAFVGWSAANAVRRELYATRFAGMRASDQVAQLARYFGSATAWQKTKIAAPMPAASHVFLLGFARSGTTLLETVLGNAPDAVVLDERNCFGDAIRQFVWSGDAGLDRLSAMDDGALAYWRNAYWEAVRGQGVDAAGKILIDKNPFHSATLPLIAKLFPDAKILLALRDPRDVVLSCFRHRFEMSPDSFEFLSLEDCARHYGAIMGLLELYREKLPLDIKVHRYEDMIADFAGSVRAVCDVIGLGWNESLRDFGGSAKGVRERSLSANQVRRGLYTGAAGQWRRYRDRLTPVLPILAPWVERFGYRND